MFMDAIKIAYQAVADPGFDLGGGGCRKCRESLNVLLRLK